MAGRPKRRAKLQAQSEAIARTRGEPLGPLAGGGALAELERQALAILDRIKIAAQNPDRSRDFATLQRELREYIVLIGQNTQQLTPTSVTQLYISLGVSGEDELRKLVDRGRQREGRKLEEVVPTAIKVLQLAMHKHPELAEDIRQGLFGHMEVSDELESEGP